MSTFQMPADLQTEAERAAYERGWRDRIHSVTSAAGRTMTPKKLAAIRKNARKGGRKKGSKGVRKVITMGRENPGTVIEVDDKSTYDYT